jgi:hypothetical protein
MAKATEKAKAQKVRSTPETIFLQRPSEYSKSSAESKIALNENSGLIKKLIFPKKRSSFKSLQRGNR